MHHLGPKITAANRDKLVRVEGAVVEIDKGKGRGTGANIIIGDDRQAVYCNSTLWEEFAALVQVGTHVVIHAASLAACGNPNGYRVHAADIA